jgi:hypothetical protein
MLLPVNQRGLDRLLQFDDAKDADNEGRSSEGAQLKNERDGVKS